MAGGKLSVSIAELGWLEIGEAKLERVQVAVTDLTSPSECYRENIDGIIGHNFLRNFKVTIDYPNFMLSLGWTTSVPDFMWKRCPGARVNATPKLLAVETMSSPKAFTRNRV